MTDKFKQQHFFKWQSESEEKINLPKFLQDIRERKSSPINLAELKQEVLTCQKCGLASGRKNAVFGEGDEQADLVLIGEGPGKNEDETGRPFVGRSGQLLDKILEAAGFCREKVYIANVVKCRPPNNRTPLPSEVAVCRFYLEQQIQAIKPKVVVCLGAAATKAIFNDNKLSITKIRGIVREINGVKYIPTFHPAALLRDPRKKIPVWDDFQLIRDICREGNS